MSSNLKTANRRQRDGYTIIEMIDFIAAMMVAEILATKISSHFEGRMHNSVFWIVAVVGTVVFFFIFVIVFNSLLSFLDRIDKRIGLKRKLKEEKKDPPMPNKSSNPTAVDASRIYPPT